MNFSVKPLNFGTICYIQLVKWNNGRMFEFEAVSCVYLFQTSPLLLILIMGLIEIKLESVGKITKSSMEMLSGNGAINS